MVLTRSTWFLIGLTINVNFSFNKSIQIEPTTMLSTQKFRRQLQQGTHLAVLLTQLCEVLEQRMLGTQKIKLEVLRLALHQLRQKRTSVSSDELSSESDLSVARHFFRLLEFRLYRLVTG